MVKERRSLLWIGALIAGLSVAHAQSPQQVIQEVVDAEHAADENDHSRWIYLEEVHKPKEQVLQWVAGTEQGDVQRVLEKNEQKLTPSQQRDLIQSFLHDPRAQKKQISESDHDNKQIDDLLKLLPAAFLWTQTGSNATDIFLHFEPAPHFHPPTREARVFSSMAGDVVVDKKQHRILNMNGHLMREVTFGGGLLGKLKEGSSFSLEQAQVGPSLWQLTAFHVRLEGNALLFKSISLQQDDKRSAFAPEPSTITLDQAAIEVMNRPEAPASN
ncbi:hypothetical protein [Silvibacterium acidisoli]|uniref:hypothetical protein n=1 Tax=Acidobacteriaceae bacterium ZG23-2 TaxID=2883246 RepID=UPI00406C11E0